MVDGGKALERLWTDRCTVIVRDAQADAQTHVTGFTERVLFQEEPCRLSFEKTAASGQEAAAGVTQGAKLFLDWRLEIPAGSKILVQRQGKTLAFARSGVPAVFSGHQEVPVALWRKWA